MHSAYASAVNSVVFIFAHQDDEAGIFYEIEHQISLGNNVYCIYLTRSRSQENTSTRNRESIVVLTRLGVDVNNIIFLGDTLSIIDGEFAENFELAFFAIHKVLSEINPFRIYTLAWEGGHPDHDLLHAAVILSACKLNILERIRQFSLYNGFECIHPFFRVMHPIQANGLIERRYIPFAARVRYLGLILRYRSQWKTWVGLLPFFLLHYIFIRTQLVQPVSLERIFNCPHEGSLYYENRNFSNWNRVQDLVEKFYKKLELY